MKTANKVILGLGSILALAFATSALAGPSPQFWEQQERLRAEIAAKAKAAAAAPAATPATSPVATPATAPAAPQAMPCPACRTKNFVDVAPPNPVNKYAVRDVTAGTRHYCSNCKGTITEANHKVTDGMKRTHADCATANCCKITS